MTALFTIRHRPDLSLADVVRSQGAGGAVMRSAHAGNWYPSNLSVASLGIRCVVATTTVTKADVIYHPAGVIVGRRYLGCLSAPSSSLVFLTSVRDGPKPAGLEELFPKGCNLAQAHLDALRKAEPQANVTRYDDFLSQQAELAHAVIEICADTMPELWHRRTSPHRGVDDISTPAPGESPGNSRRRLAARVHGWAELRRGEVFGLTDATRGWLIPTAVITLTMAVLDACRYGTSEVYHLSGPAMVHYIDKLATTLSTLYAAVAKRLGLPAELVFNLVPTAHMTLGAPREAKDALDDLVESYLATTNPATTSLGGNLAALSTAERRHAARARKAERLAVVVGLTWAAAGCAVPFYDPRDANFCSQYDLLVRDQEWYVPQWGVETPLGEVGKMVRKVAALRV